MFEQMVVGQEDSGQPCRFNQGAQGCDVVHERVFGFYEGHMGVVVQRPGNVDSAVTAADDDNKGTFRWILHCDSSVR